MEGFPDPSISLKFISQQFLLGKDEQYHNKNIAKINHLKMHGHLSFCYYSFFAILLLNRAMVRDRKVYMAQWWILEGAKGTFALPI